MASSLGTLVSELSFVEIATSRRGARRGAGRSRRARRLTRGWLDSGGLLEPGWAFVSTAFAPRFLLYGESPRGRAPPERIEAAGSMPRSGNGDAALCAARRRLTGFQLRRVQQGIGLGNLRNCARGPFASARRDRHSVEVWIAALTDLIASLTWFRTLERSPTWSARFADRFHAQADGQRPLDHRRRWRLPLQMTYAPASRACRRGRGTDDWKPMSRRTWEVREIRIIRTRSRAVYAGAESVVAYGRRAELLYQRDGNGHLWRALAGGPRDLLRCVRTASRHLPGSITTVPDVVRPIRGARYDLYGETAVGTRPTVRRSSARRSTDGKTVLYRARQRGATDAAAELPVMAGLIGLARGRDVPRQRARAVHAHRRPAGLHAYEREVLGLSPVAP